ncbi:MAG TPA: DUF948 domain-containing protein [Candidatus Angelobacter sp.]|nr:DUF948 domain-containing protein [Candidatus Angelobacter sp.]
MEWILALSVALLAIAFTILVIFVAQTLKSAQHSLNKVSETLGEVVQQMDGITSETTKLLHKTNVMAEDLYGRTKALNPVFDSIEGIGESIQTVNASIRRMSNVVTEKSEKYSEEVVRVLQWGDAAMSFWNKWKPKRPILPESEEK